MLSTDMGVGCQFSPSRGVTEITVTVPAVRSTMVLVGALSSVAAFKVFSEVYLMAGPSGGPAGEDTTLVMLVQRTGTEWWRAKSRPTAKQPFEGYVRQDRLVFK